MLQKSWKVKSKVVSGKKKDWLSATLAKNRGLKTPQQLDEFLNPKLDHILGTKITDVEVALSRIDKAIKNKEKIRVYSDYDADGLCAAAIMWETLYDLGAHILPYVPHRIREGYGLASSAITKLAEEGVTLLITVDHGVTATKQVEHAKAQGVDVIITDHHVLPKELPKAVAIVHTTKLCGAGVSWRLSWEITKKLKPSYRANLMEKLELAAIATVADLVPLVDGNRAIVKLGLERLKKSTRPGITAILNESKMTGPIGTYEIGHIIAPRINAMGRIEHGLDALRLLCAKNKTQAEELATILGKTNSKRKDMTQKAIAIALDMETDGNHVGVIADSVWHEGVIGLVASRLVESYNKPMIVISLGEIYSKGSARSIPGFNIVEAIRDSSEYLVDAGGHPMAAGFTIETKNIATFSRKINQYAKERITKELLTPVIDIECELGLGDINPKILPTIKKFEPYGVSNPEPIFLTKKMLVEDARTVGIDNKHLRLQLSGLSAIAFNQGERIAEISPGSTIDAVYTLAKDNYAGGENLQLKVKDFQV